MEKLSGRYNVFIISKRQSSFNNKFYDRNQTLQAEAISDIVRIDWPDWLVLYQFFIVIIKSATKCNRVICMFHWMLVVPQALKNVLPVEDSFSNTEMPAFSPYQRSQSTSETFNISLWRTKTKPASVNYCTIVVLATNKTCGTFPWQASVFSVVEHHVLKMTFHHNDKKNLFHISTNIPTFFRYIGWPENPETDIVASSDSVSQLIYRVFRWYISTFFCYCTAG